MNKKLYERPATVVFEVKFEDGILQGSPYHVGGGGTYSENEGTINNNGDF